MAGNGSQVCLLLIEPKGIEIFIKIKQLWKQLLLIEPKGIEMKWFDLRYPLTNSINRTKRNWNEIQELAYNDTEDY